MLMVNIKTPWKKSRKFGDIHGGRTRLRFDDNIFMRAHSLKRPHPNETLPILIQDNPSRDFFFPISVEEALTAIKALPNNAHKGITHIWLRRFKKSEFEKGKLPLAELIWGSGVRVIILYPFPKNMIMNFGVQKPSNRRINELAKWNTGLKKEKNKWVMEWELESLREYYVSNLLYHEVGHHVDQYYREYKKSEEFANQYAIQHTAIATEVIEKLS